MIYSDIWHGILYPTTGVEREYDADDRSVFEERFRDDIDAADGMNYIIILGRGMAEIYLRSSSEHNTTTTIPV